MSRIDGRNYDQLRPVEIIPHINKFAEGSCLIRCGNTHVLCPEDLNSVLQSEAHVAAQVACSISQIVAHTELTVAALVQLDGFLCHFISSLFLGKLPLFETYYKILKKCKQGTK